MAFINKQEEVIKLKLTQHGKKLLSTGRFKPYYYAMFDDDIIYDPRYAGVSEHQNSAQDRIKEQPRRDTQHVSVPIEHRYGIASSEINSGIISEFDSLIYPARDTENEKVLGFCLTNMEMRTREAPRFELDVFESEIENSSSLRYDLLDGSRTRIPQLDFKPELILIRDSMAVDFLAPESTDLVDSETFQINPAASKIEFLDNSFLERKIESIVFSLEEFNTPYFKENFDVEVYEIVTDEQDEKLVPVLDYTKFFEIRADSNAIVVPAKVHQRGSFFN